MRAFKPGLCLYIILFLSFFTLSKLYAQNRVGNDEALEYLVSDLTSRHKVYPLEKLYLHFDKSNYAAGDTAWFKAYLVANQTASPLSGKVYVELYNDSSRLIQRFAVPVSVGTGSGYIPLTSEFINHQGSYTVRAYTKWMQNFGPDKYFYKTIGVAKLEPESWLAREQHTFSHINGADQLHFSVRLNDLMHRPVSGKNVLVSLSAGKRELISKPVITNADGIVQLTVNLPGRAKAGLLTISLTNQNTRQTVRLPLRITPAEGSTDLQFMPESGKMVAGIYNRIAFKAIGEDGLGVEVKGRILNSRNEEVAQFQSFHKGMGNFAMVPAANETYRAIYLVPGGSEHTVALPLVQSSGMVLRVNNTSPSDSSFIYINATPDVISQNAQYYLLTQNADEVLGYTPFTLAKGFYNALLLKSKSRPGLIQISIVSSDGKPLNERVIFMPDTNRLNVGVTNSKRIYAVNDSVHLNLFVKDEGGRGITGSFSASVTDDELVVQTIENTIVNRMLLSPVFVKGNIEDAQWYFNGAPTAVRALDDLLLTQAWTGLNWQAFVRLPQIPRFAPEPDNRIAGTITGTFKKPVRNARVTLLGAGKKDIFTADTITDTGGKFLFNDLPVTDTIGYTIKIHDEKGKTLAATIAVDEFIPSVSDSLLQQATSSLNLDTDSILLNYALQAERREAAYKSNEVGGKGTVLKEVVIKGRKKMVVVNNLEYAYPSLEITEPELIAQKKATLFDVLKQKIVGFQESRTYGENTFSKITLHPSLAMVVKAQLVYDFIIDGASLKRTVFPQTENELAEYNDYLHQLLFQTTADDVKSVILLNNKNTYISITTRSGHGLGVQFEPGLYVYRPVPMQLLREYYRPGYQAGVNAQNSLRSTLHWEPNLITGNSGQAGFSFYAANKRGTYTVIVEGTDFNGHYVFNASKVKVEN